MPGYNPPQNRHPPMSRHPLKSIPPTPQEQAPPLDGYCCGWYASYWNAFLFQKRTLSVGKVWFQRVTHVNNFYRPQHSCGKVMFLHLSVILLTGGSGGHPLSRQSPGRHPSPPPPPRPRWPLQSTVRILLECILV